MISAPLITIGITCFNAHDTIERAIKSAADQTYSNLEILVVDDCSSDNSVSIIQQALKGIENSNFVRHEENLGASAARQTIIKRAKGELIAFIDDDDEALPKRIETQYKCITDYEAQTGETLIACYASGTRLYPNNYSKDLIAIGSQQETPYGTSLADRSLFFGGNPKHFFASGTPSCSLMARRTTFEKVGGFDPDFKRIEDIDFAVRLALVGGNFIGCREKLFIQHSTETGDKAPIKNLEAEQQLVRKHKDYLDSIGMYYYALHWPLIRYYHFENKHGQMLWTLLKIFTRYPFRTVKHFLTTAPKRFLHERKMKK